MEGGEVVEDGWEYLEGEGKVERDFNLPMEQLGES